MVSALKRFRAYAMSLNDMRYIRSATTKPLDVHLMIEHPNTNIGLFLQNLHRGDTVYIHPEAEYHPSTTLQKIIDAGMVPGIAINPGTSIETVMEMLVIVDKVLVMSVNPGNAGQMYLPYVGKKIDKMLRLKEELGFKVYWDGACSADKIITYAPKGVDGFVFGNHTDIYNPWSILCYAREQLFKCYWIDTGGYELLSRLIVEGDNSLKIDLEALLRGDAESMEDFINDVALDMVSFFDVGRKTPKTEPERFYHGLVLGLIVELKDCYYIISNRESGRGRYDIMLKPLQDELPAILIEFKVYNAKKEKTLEDTARQALAQIEERDYARMFMNEGINAGRIKKYGFAFNGKAVMILESEL